MLSHYLSCGLEMLNLGSVPFPVHWEHLLTLKTKNINSHKLIFPEGSSGNTFHVSVTVQQTKVGKYQVLY
jgi:hypothetical protein